MYLPVRSTDFTHLCDVKTIFPPAELSRNRDPGHQVPAHGKANTAICRFPGASHQASCWDLGIWFSSDLSFEQRKACANMFLPSQNFIRYNWCYLLRALWDYFTRLHPITPGLLQLVLAWPTKLLIDSRLCRTHLCFSFTTRAASMI